MTILLIEQNANMALKVAHQAYVLETGKITMSGTGQELLENPDIKAAYLGKKMKSEINAAAGSICRLFLYFPAFPCENSQNRLSYKKENGGK